MPKTISDNDIRFTSATLQERGPRKRRILFVVESVSAAHVTRPLALAARLDPRQYEIGVACDGRFRETVHRSGFSFLDLSSMEPLHFLKRLERGAPLYDARTLRGYVKADMKLMEAIRPDLVIGDFRISLAVSARVAGIPYANVCNAHWSPRSTLPFPFPELAASRIVGEGLARWAFKTVLPLALRVHARGFNRVCAEFGLPGSHDARAAYTRGDWILFPDLPCLAPIGDAHPNEFYIGPAVWSPRVALPRGWSKRSGTKPLIYATLGSTGDLKVLKTLFEAVAAMPVQMALATAGRPMPVDPPPNVLVADYFPGARALKSARVCVYNGGAATGYQALSEGVPVLGLPANADQCFFAESVRRQGAGLLVRPGTSSAHSILRALEALLEEQAYRSHAMQLREELRAWRERDRFLEFVEGFFAATPIPALKKGAVA